MAPGALPLCTCVLPLLHTLYSCLYSGPQPTCGGYRLCTALDPSPSYSPVSSTPLPLHGRIIKVLRILRGTYDRSEASFGVQRLTARRPRPRSFGPRNGPGALPLCTCVLQLLHTFYSCLYPSPRPTRGGSRPWTLPLPAHRFPRRPAPPKAYYQGPRHAERYVRTIDSKPRSASKGLQPEGPAQDRAMAPGALPLCTCVLPLLLTLYSCLYPSP